MAPNFSKYVTKTNVSAAAGLGLALWIVSMKKNNKPKKIIRKKVEEEIKYMITEKKEPKIKAHVNMQFFRQLAKILKIVIPNWTSPEVGYMLLVATSLVCRSLCDLWLIHLFTKIESAIITMDGKNFTKRLFGYMLALPLISVVNNTLKYAVGELRIHLRTNMTRRLYDDYLKKFTYYRMANLDNRITNADQLLTTDVDKFCESLTELYCNVTKPLLDIVIYVSKLNMNLGYGPTGLLMTYVFIAGGIMNRVRRPVGQFTVNEQKLEGEFRHVNARIITHSEEIAFYQGNSREKLTVLASFNKLIGHLRKFLHFRVFMGVIDNIVTRYFALSIGFLGMALPFIGGGYGLGQKDLKERSRLYYAYGTMMVRLGQAIGRLILAGRELSKLAGFTVRVTQLQQVLDDLNDGKYQREMVAGSEQLKANGRLVFKNNIINFNRVPIITPNGDVLIKELSMEVHSGMNVIVCGPNGSGKSSLFRILGELWPLFGGELTKPPRGKLFYIPQRPYMTLGCLRDQITYPHSGAEALRRGCNDEKLKQHLKLVQLEYLLEREGGFDAVADWLEILSGGEKQRIAMARLFYHAPEFAILDECTSAVSLDVEESMYKYCREVGITLLTVSHRKSLWQHHEYVLYLDGRGDYSFKKIEPGMEQFGS